VAAELGPYRVEVATDFGPRITSLRLGDGPEQFADLGHETILEHDGGTYEFRGGHRLWAAPEDPSVTYAPDNHRCKVSVSDVGLSLLGPEDEAGMIKEIAISREDDSLVVEHRMSRPAGGRALAPWAITQLPMGGTAILPYRADGSGPTANRYLVLWPYTSLEDRRLALSDEAIEIEALEGRQLKLGAGPSPGKLGYFRDGFVFIKEIESAQGRDVPDFGASGQIYVGQGFCELESVGGLTDLSDGGVARLRERWSVAECADLDAAVRMTVA
jgi:hypothetical protein